MVAVSIRGGAVIGATYSPFTLLHAAFPSPVAYAWVELLHAMIAGLGAYAFFSYALRVSFWPAAVGAWCYPLTGFFVLWAGFPLTSNVVWLPWSLVAVEATIRQGAFGRAAPALAVVTGLVIVSGQLDIAGQVLLTSGLYALWCLADRFRGNIASFQSCRAVVALSAAWLCGILLAAIFVLPVVDYLGTGRRMQDRSAGSEERPPVGVGALPQVVFPDFYGRWQQGWIYITEGNRLESSAAGYVGLVATLLAAPLAFCDPRQLSRNMFWIGLVVLSLAWQLNIPGLVDLLRQPGVNMLAHNRFVFAGAFALLSMATVGLNCVGAQLPRVSAWTLVPRVILVLLCALSFYRMVQIPNRIQPSMPMQVTKDEQTAHEATLTRVATVRQSFRTSALAGAMFCLVAIVGWQILLRSSDRSKSEGLNPDNGPPGEDGDAPNLNVEAVAGRPHWLGAALSLVMILELVWSAYGVNPQCDPDLYYPEIPILTQLASHPPGRILGVNCFPPALNEKYGLRDIRGYDAADPDALLQVLALCQDTAYETYPYARTLWFVPWQDVELPEIVKPSPVLDMLNVRYFIFRKRPPETADVLLKGDEYWVVENPDVLPRVFIPERVESLADERQTLQELASPDFNPREVAYVDSGADLPDRCRGVAQIVDEIPTRIQLRLDMHTPGLVVLADRWDKGWRAWLNGKRAPILRTNYVLRGVVVPSGRGTLEFRYEPQPVVWGMRITAAALAILLAWLAIVAFQSRTSTRCTD